jgi:hypothetical protein
MIVTRSIGNSMSKSRDGTCSWVALDEMTESNPIELVEYTVAVGVAEEAVTAVGEGRIEESNRKVLGEKKPECKDFSHGLV